jgi:hypothetical protein
VVLVEYNTATLTPSFISRYHTSTIQWVLYDQFISQNEVLLSDKYDKVMFADVKDTAFQADPFFFLPHGSSFVFQEGSVVGTPISQSKWTAGRIQDCFGEKILASVEDKSVINSGVSIASFDKGRYYVHLMSSILIGESGLTERFPACEREGVDQGVHNVIVHLGLVPGMEAKSEVEFPLVNIHSSEVWNNPGMLLENLQTHTYDRVLNSIHIQPLAVVHQYNSVASLSQELAEKFVYWKNYDDALEMWRNEKSCGSFDAFVGKDSTKVTAEIGSARVLSADQCCAICGDVDACTSFSYSEGICRFKSSKVGKLTVPGASPNWRDASYKPSPIPNKNVDLYAFR